MAASGRVEIQRDMQEEAEFPVVCENCLGPDPYVRMLKSTVGHECHVCQRACTAFKFKPGGVGTRYKSTVICQSCAKTKNLCQVCMFDLTYGLPVQVVDNPNLNESDLRHLARTTPYYKRNKARICSFWVKGTCNRGAACPYRHELPADEINVCRMMTSSCTGLQPHGVQAALSWC